MDCVTFQGSPYPQGKKEAEVTGCDLPKLMNTLNEMAARPEVAG